MKFYIKIWNEKYKQNTNYPCILIENNGWDDYGFKTLFHLYYCKKDYHDKLYIGDVKILSSKNLTTIKVIPESFNKLGDEFCSLGQSIDYYRKLANLDPEVRDFILNGLNDVVFYEKYYNLFKEHDGFIGSLLRNSEASRIIKNRNELIEDIDFRGDQVFSFTYTSRLLEAESEHILDVDFNKIRDLPNRINAIIGKNGTGKTALLSNLAKSMVLGRKSQFSKLPSYSKVISVSYSAFDEFFNPNEEFKNNEILKNNNINRIFNYIYCGLRDESNILTYNDLRKKFNNSFEEIKKRNRKEEWEEILYELFEDEKDQIIANLLESNDIKPSSGQGILLVIFTEVIANIEPESLILFDEPEIHLHPNAISNLMRMINKLLDEFNSYCIISTHSPLVIQEIPSRYVRVFERYGNVPSVKKLELECFGENISNIINDVFRVSRNESNYKTIFQNLLERKTIDEINYMFENKLSFNALTFLSTLEYIKESE